MNILILILEGYQDIELSGVIGTINYSGELKKITYFNPNNKTDVFGSNKIGSIKTTFIYNVNDYDAIFIPGGKSTIELRKNTKALSVIKDFIDNDKYIIAICDVPNALYETMLICNKKYTSYPISGINKISSKNRIIDAIIMIDGRYITGRGPSASIDLGLKVIEILISKDKSEEVKLKLFS